MNWRLLIGDVREKLAEIEAGSVQCAVTSPPYYMLRDYEADRQIGREDTEAEYIAALASVSDGVARALKATGTFWLNLGDRFAPDEGQSLLPHRVALALKAHGWCVRCDVVWNKTRWMPNGGFTRPILVHEYVFMLTRQNSGYLYNADALREPHSPVSLKRWEASGVAALGAPKSLGHKKADGEYQTKKVVANPLGKLKTSVWDICPSSYDGAHFAVMPEELAETCIKASSQPGDLVLDPFTGSGTTGAVALRLGREFVGVELNQEYAALARTRIVSVAPLFAHEESTSGGDGQAA